MDTQPGELTPDDLDGENDSGVLDPEDSLADRGVDPLDEGWSPAERPWAVEDWGTTGAEESAGEGLAARLARELPDEAPQDGDGLGDATDTDGELLDDEVGDVRAGRLTEDDEGSGPDDEPELHARDRGYAGGAASAEEAAVHLVTGER
ncbi:DUF5709 domain-containing protein [Geodermatophilus marinus]|uniref:DUF5709 domain-containing protein n=1 Tax=Geodermatophilus sp. LHW52908 TaxID=2303986 RepID=UPI000E3CF33D|nr:DUF5709 domain-containing protein [Geodermatophilus sp. LHW52908]RFU21626.1 hypothetical protein D0Z06_10540 [Geodermatophilus sp. LHW52908]